MNLYNYVLTHSGRFILAGNGVYACRPIRGQTSGYSTHAEGRAMDISRALPSGAPDGRPIPIGSTADSMLRNWMSTFVANHEALGVQRVLYKATDWRCDRGYTKASTALALLHANHMHVEHIRLAAVTLTTAKIAQVLGSPLIPQPPAPPLTPEDDMRRTVMVPGGKPTAQGRWPFWMLTDSGNEVVSCNGAPALAGSTVVFSSPVVTIPTPHRPIIGIEPAPDGNGVIACADDQSTYTLRVK